MQLFIQHIDYHDLRISKDSKVCPHFFQDINFSLIYITIIGQLGLYLHFSTCKVMHFKINRSSIVLSYHLGESPTFYVLLHLLGIHFIKGFLNNKVDSSVLFAIGLVLSFLRVLIRQQFLSQFYILPTTSIVPMIIPPFLCLLM